MSFPPGTEMFQFPGFASHAYGFSMRYPCGWVSPFGDPRINACSRLPKAFRSVPRPSSPLGAKASTRCPCFPPPPPATTTNPAGRNRHKHACQNRQDQGRGPSQEDSSDYYHKGPFLRGTARIPMPDARPAQETERPRRRGRTRDLPMPVTHDARRIAPSCPRRAPHHHLTMSKQHRPATTLACAERGNAWWAWADLNGRPHAYQACALTS